MNIGIIGYGVMGKLVEEAINNRGHVASLIVDPDGPCKVMEDLQIEEIKSIDVFIDFSSPECALSNIKSACRLGKPLVMATTGWYDQIDEAGKAIDDAKIGFIWGSNFSIGVNLFWKTLEKASELIGKQSDYDVFTHEFHHKRKKDSPSGTAITTAEKILANHPAKRKIVTERLDRAIEPDELHVSSTRGGDVPGTHEVYFDSAFDTIKLSHTARSREGFALGSVIAAEWIVDKIGFFDFAEEFEKILAR